MCEYPRHALLLTLKYNTNSAFLQKRIEDTGGAKPKKGNLKG